jgi:hypothetical protein
VEAEVLLGLVRTGSYTLASARAESAEILRLLEIEAMGRREGGER